MKREENKVKSIFFATLGCRLNQAETEKFRADALNLGFELTSDKEKADIFILNSCSVTDKAQRDTDKILKILSKKYFNKEIIVTGCGAKKKHEKYGIVILNNEKQSLFDNIRNSEKNTSKEQEIYSEKTRLMYKVQDGCNNFCSYCIVPYLRGRERSFSLNDIMNELKIAEKRGFKEIVLCGVNIGKWGEGNVGDVGNVGNEKTNSLRKRSDPTVPTNDLHLSDLIKKILENTTFPRIRLSSINPDDFSDDLVDLWAKNSRLCPHFHISLQSGSDTVLKRMGRKYNTKQYAGLAAKLRENIKDIQITTDIIVGFPGETEAEFVETIDFVKKMQFLKVHVFRYSPREGTRAANMESQILDRIKKERAVQLQKLESEIRQKILKDYIGKEVEVLFEQKKNEVYSGFTPNYMKVYKKSKKDLTNQIIEVKITGVKEGKLTGS